jgi:flagellar basal-body rod protein FlgB
MNMIDKALGVHAQALSLRSRRMELLGLNIANSDTPNFKAKDVDFKSVLQATASGALNVTNKAHLPLTDSGSPDGEVYRIPYDTSFDGNTVEMNVEQAKFGQAAADYQATLNILENRLGGIRKALRGD